MDVEFVFCVVKGRTCPKGEYPQGNTAQFQSMLCCLELSRLLPAQASEVGKIKGQIGFHMLETSQREAPFKITIAINTGGSAPVSHVTAAPRG